ncbi:MAG: flagellar hook-associated protein FlgK [Rhodobacteraceae bacterium]|nr:flagellar hook-associated protein FlgK [Paracoccaceae bacterium]MCP5341332.1 flagellar hook-associated protein FlgK [Paracoccaceae bacterium]
MGLTTSFNNALSGLTASARSAEVVSSNVANALTAGYARRELNLAAESLGGAGAGVRVDGVTRAVDQAILNDRRLADGDAGNARLRSGFLAEVEDRIGLPGDAGSLTGRVAALEAALVQAASRPDSPARLQDVVNAAQDLAAHLNTLTKSVQQSRMDADSTIARQVDDLNQSLQRIDDLNTAITAQRAAGRDATGLMDQRQQLVDRVAEIVPVREVACAHDQIALFTTGGAILLEGTPARIGFAPVGVITADMTLGSGALFGLAINGTPVPSGDSGVMGGGSLGASLAIRDDLAPAIQTQLDAFARNLIERFENPAVDPTLASGQPGLFTDRGAPLDTAVENGLAGRIMLNSRVDPGAGGALWRLRDGLGAAVQGDVGDATLILALGDSLAQTRVPGSGTFIGAARSAAGLAADVLSQVATSRLDADTRASFASARQETLTELQLRDGVDTDAEMQNLLLIEQAYSANARVIRTIDDLIQQLIGL